MTWYSLVLIVACLIIDIALIQHILNVIHGTSEHIYPTMGWLKDLLMVKKSSQR
jgi:hypothetical protein